MILNSYFLRKGGYSDSRPDICKTGGGEGIQMRTVCNIGGGGSKNQGEMHT